MSDIKSNVAVRGNFITETTTTGHDVDSSSMRGVVSEAPVAKAPAQKADTYSESMRGFVSFQR